MEKPFNTTVKTAAINLESFEKGILITIMLSVL